MKAPFYLICLPLGVAATSTPKGKTKPPPNSLALNMLDSIIARDQGVTVNASVKTSIIEAGLLLIGIREVLHHVELPLSTAEKYGAYVDLVMSGLIPALANVTADKTSPLDKFSVGSEFIRR